MSQVVDVLLLAKDQIAEEGHWCRNVDVQTRTVLKHTPLAGTKWDADETTLVPYEIEEVVSYCLRGAIRVAVNKTIALTKPKDPYVSRSALYVASMQAVAKEILARFPYPSSSLDNIVTRFNDVHANHAAVLDVLDEAIATEKATH